MRHLPVLALALLLLLTGCAGGGNAQGWSGSVTLATGRAGDGDSVVRAATVDGRDVTITERAPGQPEQSRTRTLSADESRRLDELWRGLVVDEHPQPINTAEPTGMVDLAPEGQPPKTLLQGFESDRYRTIHQMFDLLAGGRGDGPRTWWGTVVHQPGSSLGNPDPHRRAFLDGDALVLTTTRDQQPTVQRRLLSAQEVADVDDLLAGLKDRSAPPTGTATDSLRLTSNDGRTLDVVVPAASDEGRTIERLLTLFAG